MTAASTNIELRGTRFGGLRLGLCVLPGLSGCRDGAGLSGDSGLSVMKIAEQSGTLLLASPRTLLSGLQLFTCRCRLRVCECFNRSTRYSSTWRSIDAAHGQQNASVLPIAKDIADRASYLVLQDI